MDETPYSNSLEIEGTQQPTTNNDTTLDGSARDISENGSIRAPLPQILTVCCGCLKEEWLRWVVMKENAPFYALFLLMLGFVVVSLSFYDKKWTMILGLTLVGISTLVAFGLSAASFHRTDTLELKMDKGFAKVATKEEVDKGFAKVDKGLADLAEVIKSYQTK